MKPEQILRARELLCLTQTQLGQALGVHWITVSKWERGIARPSQLRIDIMSGVLEHAHWGEPRTTGRMIRLALEEGSQVHALQLLLSFSIDGE